MISLALLLIAVAWSMEMDLRAMDARWGSDPRYSHGYLVPLFSAFLLHRAYSEMPGRLKEGRASWWGLLPIALGGLLHALGGYVGSAWVSGSAIVPYLMGIALLWGGRATLSMALPSILFLLFMVPPPHRIEVLLGPPLQDLATRLSTFMLQAIGLMAFSEGNVIRLGEHRIGVVEACSGLSMLITFAALATGAALVIKRPLLDRLVLVFAAVPIALIANVVRIVMTGVLYRVADSDLAEHFYHDLAGWLMIPLALVMLWGVAAILARMLVEVEERAPVLVGIEAASGAPRITKARGRSR